MAAEHTHLEGQAASRIERRRLRESYDLTLMIGLALVVPLLEQLPLLRVPLGLVLVLFGPGYVLQAALFARDDDLQRSSRLAVSFGLSAAVLPLLALLLDLLSWGIRPRPMALALGGWIVLWSSIAAVRRHVLLPADTPAVPPQLSLAPWRHGGRPLRVGLAALALLVGGIVLLIARSQATPPPTAFYTLGVDHRAEQYPRQVAPGERMQVQLGIDNREGAPMRYRIEVRADDLLLAEVGPLNMPDSASWQQPVEYALPHAGDDQNVDLLLYRADETTPYRQLRLWVDVRSQ